MPLDLPVKLHCICLHQQRPDYVVGSHRLRFHQLYVLVSGDVESTVGSRTYRLQEGQGLIISPGLARAHACIGRSPVYVWAIFETGLFGESERERLVSLRTTPGSVFQELLRALREVGTGTAQVLLETLFCSLILTLHREGEVFPAPPPPSSAVSGPYHERMVERMEGFLRRNLHQSVSNTDLAKLVSLSPSQLTRVFRSVHGVTPLHHLMRLRLEHAEVLLRDSTLSISEIALHLGFSSFSHFSRLFKRERGFSPREFRRRGTLVEGVERRLFRRFVPDD